MLHQLPFNHIFHFYPTETRIQETKNLSLFSRTM